MRSTVVALNHPRWDRLSRIVLASLVIIADGVFFGCVYTSLFKFFL